MVFFRCSLFEPFIESEVLPEGNVLLIGPPGVGKTTFCETILTEYLLNGMPTLYITLDYAPDEICGRASRRGIDLAGNEAKLIFVDGYSWLVGALKEKYSARNLSNLSDLSVKMISASNELGKNTFFLFDSISSLLVYNSENEVERFLGVNMARMKHQDNLGIWVLEGGIHSTSFYNAIRHKADGILEMRFEEHDGLHRFIRLHTFQGIHSTEWKPFEVYGGGHVAVGEGESLVVPMGKHL